MNNFSLSEPRVIERLALININKVEDIALLQQRYNLDERSFAFYPEVAKFIFDYVKEYNKPPSKELLELSYDSFDTSGPELNFEYISEEFYNSFVTRMANMIFYRGQQAIEKDPSRAIDQVILSLEKLRRQGEEKKVSFDSRTSRSLIERYKKMLNGEGDDIYPLGIEPLDNIPLPIMRNTVLGVMGDTGSGKSWIAIKIAVTHFLMGHKVVFISPELSGTPLQLRQDVVLGNACGFKLFFLALLLGKEVPGLIETYEEFVNYKQSLNLEEKWINFDNNLEDSITASTIDAIASREKPDLMVVDGIYLMDDEDGNKTSWESIKSKTKALKGISERHNLILVVTNQANKEAGDKIGPPKKSETADGYYFPRLVDILVSVGYAENSGATRDISVPKNRFGEEISSAFTIIFDPDIGDIGRTSGLVSSDDFDSIINTL